MRFFNDLDDAVVLDVETIGFSPYADRIISVSRVTRRLVLWGAGTLLFLFAAWASAEAARLENPGNDQFYSGIGAISGWKCDVSGPLTIRFNGGQPVSLIYGSERLDTRQVCGDMNNGFAVLWNWALLGDGRHTARRL